MPHLYLVRKRKWRGLAGGTAGQHVAILLAEKLSFWLGAPMEYDALYSLDRRIFSVLFFAFCFWVLAALRISIAPLIPLVFVVRALIAETGKPKLTQVEA